MRTLPSCVTFATATVSFRPNPRPANHSRALRASGVELEDVGGWQEFGVHVALHQLKCSLREVVVDVRYGVGRNHEFVATYVGVERGVEDALLGDLAGEDEAFDVLDAEEVVEGGLVEDRVS